MPSILASAPGKVILFGEHAVNRGQPALAAAVDRRVRCRVVVRSDDSYTLRSGDHHEALSRDDLFSFKQKIDQYRAVEVLNCIRWVAHRDYFSPTRYVLAHVVEQAGGPGLDLEWRSDLPTGSGMGSGAAASAAMALAALRAAGRSPTPEEVAFLAWQGDVIAHGGVASGLDSGACALGGLTLYTQDEGPRWVDGHRKLPLVIGNTGFLASTAEVNTRVRTWLASHPERMHLFGEVGLLVRHALDLLTHPSGVADLSVLGHLMNLNQLVLEKLGVSCPAIDRLVEAALSAGALGAKLSGSGGGGIIIALTEPGREADVAAAIDAAGGRSLIAPAGAPGVRIEAE